MDMGREKTTAVVREVALELAALDDATEKAYVLVEQLVERLKPILSPGAVGACVPDERVVDAACPVADGIRRRRFRIQDFTRTLSEVLEHAQV